MERNENIVSSCLPRIRSSFNDLTKTEQKTATYILENPSEVIHMTITELAEAAQNAEATVFRLCKKLGFSGYQELKIALAGDLYTPLESVYKEVDPTDSIRTMASKIFLGINEGLQDTLKIIDEDAIERAIQAITTTRRIDVYGSGGSAIIASDIEHRFMRFGISVRSYSDPHLQIASATLLQPGDLVIAVSHTGANRDVLEAVEMAKSNQVTTIAITSYLRSPLSQAVDIALHGMGREVTYRSEAMASRLIHLAIVDVLYVGSLLRQQDKIIENMKRVRKSIAKRKI
ncbi:MurR/RpiR family transcriptional regulator [Pelosinus sp. UFO1]|jgi:DNA-binding MurR/RpiR family transcriptional regulator|uniref:MurR/RpiR family transcriptional regulator n=1 Tax=Pelosinus sp. UFO1 TaxID=484770 RepID=UPI0004D14D34|nr:MurR/RpiR family transcriptional regulator [Pelosinus sp. UFO1]AIF54316.1 transcriptional regulator, RpiR family [Pelosinus sp. UFO1]